MKLTLDDIIGLARKFDKNGDIPEILEEFLNNIAKEESKKAKKIQIQEEFGEDMTIAGLNILNKEKVLEFV